MNTLEKPIHNNSEIGTLRSVLLHRPGGELENLTLIPWPNCCLTTCRI